MAAAGLACWFLVFSVLAVPVARADLFSFDLKDERELGEKFNALIRARMPLIEDTEVNDYVKGVVDRLIGVKAPMSFPITVSVINDNAVNAFAGPAGYVSTNPNWRACSPTNWGTSASATSPSAWAK